jgi:hypothetical protein
MAIDRPDSTSTAGLLFGPNIIEDDDYQQMEMTNL